MLSGIDHLGLFIVAGLLLNLTPGPDVLYILTHAVKSGWRTGAVAAAGITAGCFVHIAAAALGVSALMAASHGVYRFKVAGGGLFGVRGLVDVGCEILHPTQAGSHP